MNIEQVPDNFITTWCEKFNEKKNRNVTELSQEETNFFLGIALYEKEYESGAKEFPKDAEECFMYKVITKRLQCYHYKMTKSAKMCLALIFSENLGINTMIMTYLEYLTKKQNVETVNMEFIGMKVFPFGKPNEKFYNEMWDEQKVNSSPDNLLDYKYYLNKMWEELNHGA